MIAVIDGSDATVIIRDRAQLVTDGAPCAHGRGMTQALTNIRPISEKKRQRFGGSCDMAAPSKCLLAECAGYIGTMSRSHRGRDPS
jgi:hypothetical protein